MIDPRTGRVTREAVDGPTNINVDRLEALLSRQSISQVHHAAGRRLQSDTEIAQLVSYGSMMPGVSGGGTIRPADAKLDAMQRVSAARKALGALAWRILELVALDGVTVTEAERRMRLPAKSGMGALLVALDDLAAHYGLA